MRIKLKRLKINKLLKIVLLLVIVLMSCIAAFLLYKEIKVPVIEEERVKLYSYTNKASADYKVILKPNNLYSSPSLGEGQYYITNYTDSIQTSFNYEFKGDRAAGLKGYYEVAARVEGYKEVDDKHITIWEKTFILFPKTDFTVNDKILALSENVNLKLEEYNDFADVILEETRVQTSIKLNVYMNVNLKADTGKDQIEAEMTPAITIPLNESYFYITESGTKEEPGSIEESKSIQLPPNKQKILLLKCGLSLLAVFIPGLLIFTEAIKKSPFVKQLDKIFKQHGNRLVALNSDILSATLDNCCIVKSIDDLVRVADEIGRPIMYEYSENYKDIVHFYVLDEKRAYLYILKDILTEPDIVVTDEKKIMM